MWTKTGQYRAIAAGPVAGSVSWCLACMEGGLHDTPETLRLFPLELVCLEASEIFAGRLRLLSGEVGQSAHRGFAPDDWVGTVVIVFVEPAGQGAAAFRFRVFRDPEYFLE